MSQKRLPFGTSVNKYINLFPGLKYTGTKVYCSFCDVFLIKPEKQTCERHVGSKRHIKNQKNKIPYWKFMDDFVFVTSVYNIPQKVVDNDDFKLFWKTYVAEWKLPTRNQLRYRLPTVKKSVEALIKSELNKKKIWITVDETTDTKNKPVVNILVRTLNMNGSSLPYLLCSRRLQITNEEVIINLLKEVMAKFDITPSQVLMLVSDGAAYMLKAGEILKETFPRLLHITCLIYACHLVAEVVRNSYPAVDKLISQTKKVFLKSPERIRIFNRFCPKISPPPQPILTRWGTWLEAVLYYNKYYHQVKSVIFKFNPQEAQFVQESQQLFQDPQVKEDLDVISQQYSILIKSLSNLQNSHLTLQEAMSIIKNLQNSLNTLTDIPGQHAHDKLCSKLNENPDLKKLLDITHLEKPNIIAQYLKFANITSYDAEKSFSNYTHTFSHHRRKLTETNTEGLLMMQFFAKSINQPLTFYM